MDPTAFTAIVSASSIAAGSLITIALRQGIEAWKTYRKTNHEIQHTLVLADDDRADKVYKYEIENQKEQIKVLQGEVITLRALRDADLRAATEERIKCHRDTNELQLQIQELRFQLNHMIHHPQPMQPTQPTQVVVTNQDPIAVVQTDAEPGK